MRNRQAWRGPAASRYGFSGAAAQADSYRGEAEAYAATQVTDDDLDTYWATDDGVTTGTLEIDLGQSDTIRYVLLQENISLGQRVSSFAVDVWQQEDWKPVAEATTIGYKRILRLDPVVTDKVRIRINDAQACPAIATVAVY